MKRDGGRRRHGEIGVPNDGQIDAESHVGTEYRIRHEVVFRSQDGRQMLEGTEHRRTAERALLHGHGLALRICQNQLAGPLRREEVLDVEIWKSLRIDVDGIAGYP